MLQFSIVESVFVAIMTNTTYVVLQFSIIESVFVAILNKFPTLRAYVL